MIRRMPLDERAADTILFAGPPNVFWYYEGEHHRHVSRRFPRYVKGSGVCPFLFHDLWHSHGVDHLRRSGWIYQLSQILGHSRVKTTGIYPQLFTPEAPKASKTATSPARAADDKAEKQH
jgi:integrase